jgi:DnaJ-class molecular chaperone
MSAEREEIHDLVDLLPEDSLEEIKKLLKPYVESDEENEEDSDNELGPCPNCQGTGCVGEDDCQFCGGEGVVTVFSGEEVEIDEDEE